MSSKPCHFHARGHCRYGKQCKFKHLSVTTEKAENGTNIRSNRSQSNGSGPTRPGHTDDGVSRGRFQQWKRLVNQREYIRTAPTSFDLLQFFSVALELMEGDVGAAQDTIRLMASESGLSFIQHAMQHDLSGHQNLLDKISIWEDQLVPMFQILTHPRVVDSAVLEQEVATIYNFIRGVGGIRMTSLFNLISSLLDLDQDSAIGGIFALEESSAKSDKRIKAVELCLSVFAKLADINTTNILNESFHSIVSKLSRTIRNDTNDNPQGSFSGIQAVKYIQYLNRRLVSHDIPFVGSQESVPASERKGFVLRNDLPGHLSSEGPRHDNDHADITQIRILPTVDEIISPRSEYLPIINPAQWHRDGIQGRLDREFRLLREDTVGQLRDAIQAQLHTAQQHGHETNGNVYRHHVKNGLRTTVYEFPTPVQVLHGERTGNLELSIRFNQPQAVKGFSLEQRQDWWSRTKRLQDGALACLLDSHGSVLYFEVAPSTVRIPKRTGPVTTSPAESNEAFAKGAEVESLSGNAEFAFVKLQLVDADSHSVGKILQWYRGISPPTRKYLIEFPGVLLAAFKHTLEALQEMYKKPDVPFAHLIAPASTDVDAPLQVPQYLSDPQSTLRLKDITQNGTELNISAHHCDGNTIQSVAENTSLDLTQSAALVNAMSRELALIQGPPGTGKSFTGEKIIKTLLTNREEAKLGPILCVCYTNHALDQLLEHLLDEGVRQMIRIGSRSKSVRLEDHNLRAIAQQSSRTKSEGKCLYELMQAMEDNHATMNTILKELTTATSWKNIQAFLEESYPHHFEQLFGTRDCDGWTRVQHRPESTVEAWLNGRTAPRSERKRPLDQLKGLSVWDMTAVERQSLYRHWNKSLSDPIITNIIAENKSYTSTKERRDRVRQDVDLRCLQDAHVIGVTTTGLARNLQLLRKLRCKVMVCEEAGEVLEAHILTALLPSVEHAILIGDHLQLRPQIQNYELQSTNPRGAQYSLDVSLFERLVMPAKTEVTTNSGLPFSVLETQRRMHPSIAALVRTTLYPQLVDGENVKEYPQVWGMQKRLYWMDHQNLEAGASIEDPSSTSHWNDFEVEMTAALVSHLVRQGEYGSDDIAVITPYLGQLHKLQHRMNTMFEVCINDRDQEDLEEAALDPVEEHQKQDLTLHSSRPGTTPARKTTLSKSVRIATVDNFQGEEAKVVVISLVRSNPQQRCGFLSTSNRINVLLSRAQHGMYLLGNANTYGHVPMWANVIKLLKAEDRFGSQLQLQCPRHPDTPIVVSRPDHFMQYAPESGCNLPCDKRLDCGHQCKGRCHSKILHATFKCLERCPRKKSGCDHACPRPCGDACHDKCMTVIRDINLTLACGHIVTSVECWQAQNPSLIKCRETVERKAPGCGHAVQMRCFEDVSSPRFQCRAICGFDRSCGHSCNRLCHRCRDRDGKKITKEDHGMCEIACGRQYNTCRHACRDCCHEGENCEPCKAPCELSCGHSMCNKPCNEPCAPCAEAKCLSSCPHSQCTMPCSAPCNWIPCSKRCTKDLACGHQCPSICGEVCPEAGYCQICASEQVKSTIVDLIMMETYEEVDLDEEPCIFPPCGHVLTRTTMDGQMDIKGHYDLDAEGRPTGIKGSTRPFSMDEVKVCATCRGSLRTIARYGRIVRRALLDETTKRFICWSNAQLPPLIEAVLTQEKILRKTDKEEMIRHQIRAATPRTQRSNQHEKSSHLDLEKGRSTAAQMQAIKTYTGTSRYTSLLNLRNKINSFARHIQAEEQPFRKVKELVDLAKSQTPKSNSSDARMVFTYDDDQIQLKGVLLAGNLLLKCDLVILTDFMQLVSHGIFSDRARKLNLDLTAHRTDCTILILMAQETHYPKLEVESHIYYAQLCYLTRTFLRMADTESQYDLEEWKTFGLEHIHDAQSLILKYPSTSVLDPQVKAAERMLNDGVAYLPVSDNERKAVVGAMMAELRGTGHWYTCERGHPFTIGQCGMPMEMARCPECDSPIGGQNHSAVPGVRHDEQMERLRTMVERTEL